MADPVRRRIARVVPLLLAGALAAAGGATAAEPVALRVFPPAIELDHGADEQRVVVQLELDDGSTLDVTEASRLRFVDPLPATLEELIVRPVRDGETRFEAEYAGPTAAVPVRVDGASLEPEVGFERDVIPILTAAGCNAGTCHGSSRGQDGFQLSLFGYDPRGDYHRITRELGSRRVRLDLPAESLLLKKATGDVPHTGGRLFSPESDRYDVVRRWVEAGALPDPEDLPGPVELELYPPDAVLAGGGALQRLVARVRYADGATRDVTPTAIFATSDDTVATVDERGRITARRRGEAFVTARYATFTVGCRVLVVPDEPAPPRAARGEPGYIDALILDKLERMRLRPSGGCSDGEFLRRVHLDVIGRLPSRADHDRFVADPAADKRERLVDELLERPEFADLWVMKWAELLQIRTDPQDGRSAKAMLLYADWLRDRITANVPFDEVVRELLTATGQTFTHPPTNFYQVERDPLKLAENTAQAFLGMQIQCAQCHNHPFDRWTMDDYYGFAAFFARVGRKTAAEPREFVIFDKTSGDARHPVGDAVVPPRFLGGAIPEMGDRSRREVLADWMTAPDNPYFARNLANRVWEHFFGVGIVAPVDDFRVSNPASNPALLDALAERFVASRYDFKQLVRDICRSEAYQRSTTANETNADDERNFSRARVRRLRAEVLLDAVDQVTGSTTKYKGMPDGARAVQLADGATTNYFLRTFGRATRDSVCACEVVVEPNLSQALHLLNGDTVWKRIRAGGVVRGLLADGHEPADVLVELYLRTLTRPPTDEESAALLALLGERPDRVADALEDVLWALLNSKEFLFNH